MFQRWMMRLSWLALVVLLAPVSPSQGQAPIYSVQAGVNYSVYRGPCPARLRFTGNIYVDRVPMEYNYEWERSDGAKSGVRVVRVTDPRMKHVTIYDDWTLSAHGTVWERLRVRSGNENRVSQVARTVVECR
jgi:hypothetical protein